MSFKRSGLLALAALLCLLALVAPAADSSPDQEKDVTHYLDHTIDWYHQNMAFCQTPLNTSEVLFRDSVQKSSLKILGLGFDFAYQESDWLSATQKAPSAPSARVAALAQQVAQIQAQLDALNAPPVTTQPTSQPSIAAQREKLLSQLNLVKTRQQVMQEFAAFNSEQSATSETLRQKIDDLKRSVPEAPVAPPNNSDGSGAASSAAAPSVPASAPQVLNPQQFGIIGLVGQLFALSHRMSEISQLVAETNRLEEANSDLRGPLRAALQDALHRGDLLGQNHDTDNSQALASQKQQLDALTLQYQQLTKVLIPLGEQNVVIDATGKNLRQWHDAVGRDYHIVLNYLLVRLGGMATALLILMGISKAWKLLTFRYVSDVRRRRQFLVVRRVTVSCVVFLILLGGVVTEFGSLATYAGLLTAGIAVALQSFLVSGVAYFFLIGRFGVRIGDRISIGGISGDVIEIGLFRLYVLELSGSHGSAQPTGRVAVFANSVLFQPTAFFKQLPGADYGWHELVLTLAPDSDYRLAEARLLKAVEQVYGEYRESIEEQHARVRESVHFPIAAPHPEGRLRIVDDGLEFVVRYPVELKRAADIDDRITRKLLEAIETEPKLKLVTSGAKIQAVEA